MPLFYEPRFDGPFFLVERMAAFDALPWGLLSVLCRVDRHYVAIRVMRYNEAELPQKTISLLRGRYSPMSGLYQLPINVIALVTDHLKADHARLLSLVHRCRVLLIGVPYDPSPADSIAQMLCMHHGNSEEVGMYLEALK